MLKPMQFIACAMLAIVLCALNLTTLSAQPAASAPTSDAAAKEAILDSSRWREMQAEFHDWLSMQVVYTPQQVEQIKAKLATEVQKMSAAELQQFLDQWDAKLKVLLGKDAAEARQWLGQFLSVAAAGYRKQMVQQLGITDVSTMTAAQIEEAIQNIRAKELHLRQERTVFDQTRGQQVQTAQKFQSAQRSALERAGESQAAQYGTYQSHLAPKRYNWRPLPPIIPWGGWW